ncbi:Gfo/Idh/MocA family protein [Pseudogracilibacillus sp. SO30301A]|uniref:Gfo/Idh/MocA family protein n=1 Tax=Pseudogracilibacillus sp. SO30301A TaxID=3098291 RepID=UPI003FA69837
MKEVRIGLVGTGWMGKSHSKSFLNALYHFGEEYGKPVFEMVSDITEESALKVKKQFGFKRYSKDWHDVVTDKDVDLVDITTPNAFHYEIAKEALLNNKHVYCEKPLSLSAGQSKELANLAKEKGLVNYVGFNNVMNPATKYIRRLVQDGKLGEITKVSGTYDQDALLDQQIPISWRHLKKISGSGTLGDLGSHLFSVLQFILGDMKAVNALTRTVIKERPVRLNSTETKTVENDDVVILLSQYENGAIGTLSSSRIATGRKNHLSFEIQGTKGTVHYTLENLNDVHVYFTKDDSVDRGFRRVLLGNDHEGYSAFQPAPGIAIGFNDFKTLETHEVLSSITKGTSYICDFNFGFKVDRIIEAILESSELNSWVFI